MQLKDAAAPLFRNGDWWPWCWWCPPVSDSPPSSSSLTAVVRDNRSSSDIYKKGGKRTRHFETFLLFNGSCASWRFSIRRIIPHFPFLLLIVQSERTGAKRVKTIKKKKRVQIDRFFKEQKTDWENGIMLHAFLYFRNGSFLLLWQEKKKSTSSFVWVAYIKREASWRTSSSSIVSYQRIDWIVIKKKDEKLSSLHGVHNNHHHFFWAK